MDCRIKLDLKKVKKLYLIEVKDEKETFCSADWIGFANFCDQRIFSGSETKTNNNKKIIIPSRLGCWKYFDLNSEVKQIRKKRQEEQQKIKRKVSIYYSLFMKYVTNNKDMSTLTQQ